MDNIDNIDNITNELFDLIRSHKYEEFKKLLDENDIDINFRDNAGNYLLTYAVKFNKPDLVELLLQKEARYDILDKLDRSILYEAIENNYDSILEILLKYNENSIGMIIVDIKDINNNIPLHYAIINRNIPAIELLIKHNSNVTSTDKKGFNSLHLSIKSRSIKIVKLILSVTTNINAKTYDGETALHIAVNLQLSDICLLLLKEGANPNIQDTDNEFTSLHYAVGWDKSDIIEYLLNYGADINIQDIYGNVPLFYAIKEDHMASFKILTKTKSYNANIWNIDGKILLHEVLDNYTDENQNHVIYLEELLNKSNLSIQDSYGNTCFHYLVQLKLWKKYKNILETKRLNIFSKNSKGEAIINYFSSETKDYDEFIDMIVKSYLYRLKKVRKEHGDDYWQEEFDKICSREIGELNKDELTKIKKIENLSDISIKNKELEETCYHITRSKIIMNIQALKEGTLSFCQRSYPMKITKCVELKEGPLLDICTFTGSTLDVLIGLIFLLKKHKTNSCSTLDKNYKQNTNLCGFYKSLGLIMNNRCEFLNFEIVWIQFKLYIIDNFSILFNKCLKSSARFIIIPLGIEMKNGSHANYLIYDKTIKEIERFEPHGGTTPIGFNYNSKLLDEILESYIKSIDSEIKYINPSSFIPKIGFQIMDAQETDRKRIGDPGGFCAMWSIWYVDQRLQYPEYTREQLIKILFSSIRSNGISFRNMIRNYTRNIIDIRDKLLNTASININDWLNDQYTDVQLDKFLDAINQEIGQCCIR